MKALAVVFALLSGAAGCGKGGSAPGRPGPDSEVKDPRTVRDFAALYASNCTGCHGSGGAGGAAIALNDPVYLAIADDATLRAVIAKGVRGTAMPAFAQSGGGMLSDEQVDAIVKGMRSRWAQPGVLADTHPPAYLGRQQGDPARGKNAFGTFCASCHGAGGRGGTLSGSIVDGSYLALVSDQYLRTLTIVGRRELGAPDWRNDVPGRPMTDQEVSDVVAWLASQRPDVPGQPYPTAQSLAGGSQ
jgi:cytochrome c oxidase cbb3-type subunit 3